MRNIFLFILLFGLFVSNYKYFVSFKYDTDKKVGYGNATITRNKPIKNMKEIREIQNWVKDKYLNDTKNPKVIIMFYRRIK